MKKPITQRQKELLTVLYEYITNTGYPPTFEEMRTQLNVASNQSVIDLLGRLKSGGYIRRNESSARSISILPLGYEALDRPPLAAFLGVSSAGSPIEAIEITGEWHEIPGGMSRLTEEIFVLKICGDSMINAGIDDGDAVLVQTKKEFSSGEIVYAQTENGATIKRFMSEDKPPYLYLKPENPEYDNILFTDDIELRGKVISVLKNNYWKPVS